MSKPLKILLYLITGLIQLVVLVEVALLFVDLGANKPALERAASDALGMDVHLDGRMRISILTGPRVELKDVRVRNRGADLVSAPQVRLRLDPLLLFDRQAGRENEQTGLGMIELEHPRVLVERDRNGRFNFEKPGQTKQRLPAFDMAGIFITDGTLGYVDRQSGTRFEAEGCDADTSRLRFAGGERAALWKSLSVKTEIACRKIRTKGLTASDLKVSIAGKDGVFDLEPIEMRLLGGRGAGSLRADFSRPAARVHTRYTLSRLRAEELFGALPMKKAPQGRLDLSVNFSFAGTAADAIKRSIEGEIALRGANLVLEGVDLDRVIADFESSQRFGLLDFSALVYAGPLGLLFSRGVNLAGAIPGSGGSTPIGKLVSDWKVERGVAHAVDVVLATNEHRIALRGKLDFVNERFDDVVVAVVSPNGCARLPHTVRGPFRKPVLDRPGALASLAGPALKFFRAVSGQCEVFYAGSVPPPQ